MAMPTMCMIVCGAVLAGVGFIGVLLAIGIDRNKKDIISLQETLISLCSKHFSLESEVKGIRSVIKDNNQAIQSDIMDLDSALADLTEELDEFEVFLSDRGCLTMELTNPDIGKKSKKG